VRELFFPGVLLVRRSSLALGVVLLVGACARIAGLDDTGGAGSLTGGTTTPEGAKIYPEQLALDAPCNQATKANDELLVQNTSQKPLDYVISGDDVLTFVSGDTNVSPLKGTLAPGAILHTRVVVTSATAGTAQKAITVKTGTTQTIVPVALHVTGASIAVSPPMIQFSDVHADSTTPPQDIVLTNKGTSDVYVTGWTGGDPAITMGSVPITVPANGVAHTTATYHAGAAQTSVNATFTPVTSDGLCGSAPMVQLTGSSVSAEVTVNPGALDFGNVDCGQDSDTKMLSITNFSPVQANYTITLQSDTWVSADSTNGKVDGNGKTANVSLRVNRQDTPGSHGETVTVNVTGTGTGTDAIDPVRKDIPLTVSVRGALLAFSPASLTMQSGQTVSTTITNQGNESVGLFAHSTPDFDVTVGNFGRLSAPGDPLSTMPVDVKANKPGKRATVTFTVNALFGDGPICGSPGLPVMSP
jgi:hypothetical protein